MCWAGLLAPSFSRYACLLNLIVSRMPMDVAPLYLENPAEAAHVEITSMEHLAYHNPGGTQQFPSERRPDILHRRLAAIWSANDSAEQPARPPLQRLATILPFPIVHRMDFQPNRTMPYFLIT